YAVLAVGPGWDWTTMIDLYPDVETYTAQLRALEAFVRMNRSKSASRFVLAYHYLTQGHIENAVDQLKQVVALSPQDTLAAQLIKQFEEPSSEPSTPPADTPPTASAKPAKQGKLPGDWSARPAKDTTIRVNISDDATFKWIVESKGKAQ